MFESLLASEIARCVVGFAFGFGLWMHFHKEEEIQCNRCEYLVRRGGGLWKYECEPRGQMTDRFDKPPKYCKYFKERSSDKEEDE